MTTSKSSLATSTEDFKSPTDLDLRKLFSLSLSNLKLHQACSSHHFKHPPFGQKWIYGYNSKAPVINLNSKGSTIVFYAACNCAVLYNWTMNNMTILQGHKHMITCLAADDSCRWLATADSGSENVVIIWDSTDNFPQRTLFNPHGCHKLEKMALSGDAKFLLTLAYGGQLAYVYWWIWSEGKDLPHATIEVPMPVDAVVAMEFNRHHSEQFIILTKHDLWIGVSKKIFLLEHGVLKETSNYELEIHCPKKTLHSDVGRLNCFTDVKTTSQIIAGTKKGAVLIYGYTMQYQKQNECKDVEKLRFIKVLKIEQSGINIIKYIDDIVVTGNEAGEIHFYDDQMKLLYWIHEAPIDSVRGLSFNCSPRSYKIFDVDSNAECPCWEKPGLKNDSTTTTTRDQLKRKHVSTFTLIEKRLCPCWEKVVLEADPVTGELTQKLIKSRIPASCTTSAKPFLIRDFVIVTLNQGILFCDFVTEKCTTILNCRPSYAAALAIHPQKPLFCTGFKDGYVELTNLVEHQVVRRISLPDSYKKVIPPHDDWSCGDPEIIYPKLTITCLKYSPTGVHLACGLDTGQLLFLDPCTIDINTKIPYKDTKCAIHIITYSPDSKFIALADVGLTVLVYKYDCEEFQWSFVGKHRAHYKDITALTFLPRKNPDGEWKLISLGRDRVLVEYDIGKSKDERLELLEMNRVDQTAVPLTAIPWPTPSEVHDPTTYNTDLPLILVANDEFKYKIVNYDNTQTMATVLGPRYEHPVCRVALVQRFEGKGERSPYLLFTTNKLIGLQQLPIDGNPWRHIAMLGHPNQLMEIAWVDEYKTLLTIGQKDSCICQWRANFRLVDDTMTRGGTDLDPYYCLIENGRPGWLFQEVRDLFYYIQILCQGTFTPAMRTVSDRIPIDSLPDLMRALGFFPSEYQVANLLREARYKVYLKEPVPEVDFEEFVKLYINHRPALGEDVRKITGAYKMMAENRHGNFYLSRDNFINILCEYGEKYTKRTAWYLLSILSGHSFEDRARMIPEDFSFLPEVITFQDLMSQIMGVNDDYYDTASSAGTSTVFSTDTIIVSEDLSKTGDASKTAL